jgi:hypothetical protein
MKELLKTKVTVRLRKAEFRKEWYIYLESYPVMIKGKKLLKEFVSISTEATTVEFDKKDQKRLKIQFLINLKETTMELLFAKVKTIEKQCFMQIQ